MDVTPEQLETIEKVARRLAHTFKFGYHDYEDIVQEGIIEGLLALERYDESLPLENFMSVHIHNRLYNFKRNNYFRPDQPKNKKNLEKWEKKVQQKISLMRPMSIEGLDEHFPVLQNYLDHMAYDELIENIDRKLPPSLRTDFLRMVAGLTIPYTRKVKVQNAVLQIIQELGIE